MIGLPWYHRSERIEVELVGLRAVHKFVRRNPNQQNRMMILRKISCAKTLKVVVTLSDS